VKAIALKIFVGLFGVLAAYYAYFLGSVFYELYGPNARLCGTAPVWALQGAAVFFAPPALLGSVGLWFGGNCENLEAAYVAVDEGGTVRVTDDRRTFQYLDERTDSTYVPLESLDLAAAAQVCGELRVELRSAAKRLKVFRTA
jgi:hypothetical protein